MTVVSVRRFPVAAGQLRPLRHHIYRGAVVGVRGAAVGARGAVVGARGAAVGNIGMHTYIRHICILRPCACTGPWKHPSKPQTHIFWVAVMLWSAAFLFRELKKVDFSSMRLSGAWFCGLEPWLRALLVSR